MPKATQLTRSGFWIPNPGMSELHGLTLSRLSLFKKPPPGLVLAFAKHCDAYSASPALHTHSTKSRLSLWVIWTLESNFKYQKIKKQNRPALDPEPAKPYSNC